MKMSSSKVAAATTALAITAVARASESADTGVTEMNAGIGTVGLLLGGVAAMGVAIWVLMKFLNRNQPK